MMNDILNHIDDLKKIRGLIKSGDTKAAVKQCEECIAYYEKEAAAFDKWCDEESQKEFSTQADLFEKEGVR